MFTKELAEQAAIDLYKYFHPLKRGDAKSVFYSSETSEGKRNHMRGAVNLILDNFRPLNDLYIQETKRGNFLAAKFREYEQKLNDLRFPASKKPTITTILYTNWKGVTKERKIWLDAPKAEIIYDSNFWHTSPQWMLRAVDADTDEVRTFALSGIKAWGIEAVSKIARPAVTKAENTLNNYGDEEVRSAKYEARHVIDDYPNIISALHTSELNEWIGSGANGISPVGAARREPFTMPDMAAVKADIKAANEATAARIIAEHLQETETLKIGDWVEKYTGDAQYNGVIVSIYKTRKGQVRYVIDVEPQNFQMIVSRAQIRAVEPDEATAWIVKNGSGTRYRTWENGVSAWTEKLSEATHYVRKQDAEAAHREDEDAWTIELSPLYASRAQRRKS